jgi:hypothetical protein
MSEFIITGYQRLVEVQIVHHYFLDDGAEDFHTPKSLSETQAIFDIKKLEREKRWNLYDLRKVLGIQPTPNTKALLGRLQGVFRQTATGFLVALPKATVVPASARFDFIVTVLDSNFFQYTGLPFYKNDQGKVGRNQKIVEIRHNNEVYRYKPNVFVFGNKQGTSRKTAANKPDNLFFLNNDIPTYNAGTSYLAEWLVLHNNSVYRAICDKPMHIANDTLLKNWQHLSHWPTPTSSVITPFDVGELPPYVNQSDIPDIVPPPGATGVPAKGILLTDDLPDDIFALIRIEAMPTKPDFQLLAGGQLRVPHPIFKVHFKNRAAYWRYFSKIQKKYAELAFSPPPLGLTAFGNAMMNSVNHSMVNPKKPYPVAIEVETSTTGDLLKMYANVPQNS